MEVTQLLHAVDQGRDDAFDRLFALIYDDLRRMANAQLRQFPAHETLNATALVHEAYMKLVRQEHKHWENRQHLFGLLSMVMRRLIITYAERKSAQKRGGGVKPLPLDEALHFSEAQAQEVLALDEALTRLSAFDERLGKVVELHFFVGLTQKEIGEALDISERTVKRDWKMARAWLSKEMGTT